MAQWPMRITDRGYIYIPKEVREQLGLAPGDPVRLTVNDNGRHVSLEIRIDDASRDDIEGTMRKERRMEIQRQQREDARRLPPITMTVEKAFGAVQSPYHLSVEEAEAIAKEEYIAHLIEKMRRA